MFPSCPHFPPSSLACIWPLSSAWTAPDTSFVDPTLELDVYADKPWALSPVLSTMNHLSLNKSVKKDEDIEPPTAMGIFRAVDEDALHVVGRPDENGDVARRRRFFGDAGNRELVTFDKELEAGMEFGSGFLGMSLPRLQAPSCTPPSARAS